MAHCEDYIELISAAVDGALSHDEQEKLNAHLSACPACQNLYDDLTALHAALADLPPVEVPAGLKGRIMDAVAAEAENTKVVPFAPKKASRHWQRWMASAAVLAVVLMGTWSWKPWEAQKPQVNSPTSNGVAGFSDSSDQGQVATPAAQADGGPQQSVTSAGASLAAPAPEPSAVPESTSATFTDTSAPAEKNAVRSAKAAPSQSPNVDAASQDFGASGSSAPVENGSSETSDGEMVYGYDPGSQTADTSTTEDVPSAQSVPAGEISSFQAPAEAPAPQGAVTPRLFSTPIPPRAGESNGSGDSQPTPAPRLSSIAPTVQAIPSPAVENIPEQGQGVTSQAEAVNVLVNYIYEFVGDVKPVEDSGDSSYTVNSPTGVSGIITCVGEYETAYLFVYQDSLSPEVFHYSVSRSTGEVFLLGQEEPLSDPAF